MIFGEAQMVSRIGFVQGDLMEPADKRGRGFLTDCWREEFSVAQKVGFELIEWRIGDEPILMNPVMSSTGRDQMRRLSRECDICIPSLSADFMMQSPFYKVTGREHWARLDLLGAVIEACAEIGIKLLVVPLANGGQQLSSREAAALRSGLDRLAPLLEACGVVLSLESDLDPPLLASLIEPYPADRFGITYTVGCRASTSADAHEALAACGNRIVNVHLKDWNLHVNRASPSRQRTNLAGALNQLRLAGYRGDLILQSTPGNCRAALLAQYGAMAATWWSFGGPDHLSLAPGMVEANENLQQLSHTR
ncbi:MULTISPECIES: sugar phosphate isomerase/epimerase [unclassified Bradyrhizobium]|uniref:sugar phosphate isomerase/epimerase family protein n=2 Tax=unclassified Bradyrhizobium TaxID=2631580 RepID=UPI0029168B24|nr:MULTISPECIES: sugar phosphate isomerase/epimerase [unclassified Bradyrhizobium]